MSKLTDITNIAPMAQHNKDLRILIVDDEEFQRTVLNSYIKKFGFRSCLVSSGIEAIEFCQSLAPDLILLDVKMPDKNGIETCAELTAIDSLKHTPIIMLTGVDESNCIQQSFSAGASDFLVKPVNEVMLRQRIQYALYNADVQKSLCRKEIELIETQKLAHIGKFEISAANRLIKLSSSCEGLIGLSSKHLEMSFNEYCQHIHQDDIDHFKFTINDAIENKSPYIIEYRLVMNDQEYIIYQNGEFIEIDDDQQNRSYLIGSFQDVTDERNARENLNYSRYYDSLTDLTNRAFFESQIHHTLQHPPADALFMVVFIGLDHFTHINDDIGHSGGDRVLQIIASRLREYEDEGHIVSRFSGDVFTLLVKHQLHIDDCSRFLESILDKIKAPVHYDGEDYYLTASIGASVFPLESESGRQLLIGAEAAMMLSAEEGGDRYTYRTHRMNTETQKRLSILKELRSALDNQEFIVYYQPQIHAHTLQIVGMEALVRWQHPEKGMISPADFIPVAEESGFIQPIGDFVLKQACLDTKHWLDMGYKLTVGINISAQQFEKNHFVEHIRQLILDARIPFEQIEIEITESMAIKDHVMTIEKLQKIRQLGIRTSMDDFGTGYSSLSQLQALPLDTLKVDQAFVKQIRKCSKNNGMIAYENTAIANAIIVMSHNLGLKVIAEGVETMDQCEFLQNLNSEVLQGFLFSRPISRECFEDLIVQQSSTGRLDWAKINKRKAVN